ncbi:MAG: sigma-70 family RNA polymerase sigma factor [Acidobacteria bacterium]|nr:sigma-70 family RNA polymerase sigma factor [Acidobacteriota bacterium]
MGIHADKRRIRDYLAGERSTIQELDSWIRREIEICYPVLSREVDDICQVVHGKLIQNLRGDRFEHRSALKTYIGRMTHHTAIDCLRKEYRDRTVPEGSFLETRSTGDNPYRSMAALEEHRLIHQVLLRSPPSCRNLWRMIFMERLSYEEVGRRIRVPVGTVKSRVWHCRRKALALLAKLRWKGAQKPGRPHTGR